MKWLVFVILLSSMLWGQIEPGTKYISGGYGNRFEGQYGYWYPKVILGLDMPSVGDLIIGNGIYFGLGPSDLKFFNIYAKAKLGLGWMRNGSTVIYGGGSIEYFMNIWQDVFLYGEGGIFTADRKILYPASIGIKIYLGGVE